MNKPSTGFLSQFPYTAIVDETPTPATAGEAGEPQIIESLLDLEPATDQDMIDMGRCPNCGYPVRDHFRRATPAAEPGMDKAIKILERDVQESLRMAVNAGIGFEQGNINARRLAADADRKAINAIKAIRIAAADPAPGEGE
jgi:hypothetical protein